MADENKTVILGIELDVSELVASAAEARKEILALKEANKELAKAEGDNTVAIEENNAKIRQKNQILKQSEKQIDAITTVNKKNTGSIVEQRAQLSAATIAYNNLSKEQRINSKEGIKLKDDIKKLSDELKANEGAIGDNRRNVGNYSEALNSLPGPLGGAVQGVEGLKSAFQKLLANPVVLLIAGVVLALKGLHAAFTSTDSGALEFDVRMNQLKSTFDVAKERAFSFGRALIDLFKGDNESAAKNFSDALGITGQSFSAAAAEARRYTEALDDIEDREKAYIAHAAENANKIARLKVEAVDKGNTREERLSAIKEAIALEKEEADERVSIARATVSNELAALQVKTGIDHKELLSFIKLTEDKRKLANAELQRKYNDNHEEFQALTEKYAKFVEADTTYHENIRKLKGQETSTKEQIDAEEEQKHQEFLRKKEEREEKAFQAQQTRLKDEKAAIQVQVNEAAKGSEQEFQIKVFQLEKEKEIELSQKNLTANQKLLIESNYQVALKKLSEDAIKAEQDALNKALQEKQKTLQSDVEQRRVQEATELLRRKQAADEQFANGLIDEKQYNQSLNKINEDAQITAIKLKADELRQKAELETTDLVRKQDLLNQAAELDRQAANEEKANIQDVAAIRKQAALAGVDLAASTFGAISSLFDQQSEEYKAFATAQVVASSIQAVQSAFTSAQASPITFLFPGYPFLQAAAAAAFGALQVAKIQGVEFYEGGYTGEGSPTETSTRLGSRWYTYHKDEYIVPSRVLNTDKGSHLVGQLESMRTGSGSGIAGFYDGGFANRYVSSPVQDSANTANALQSAIDNMKTPVVLVDDINSKQAEKIQVERRANF